MSMDFLSTPRKQLTLTAHGTSLLTRFLLEPRFQTVLYTVNPTVMRALGEHTYHVEGMRALAHD